MRRRSHASSSERFAEYEKALDSASISRELRPQFRKWLRFYLDFCAKYGYSPGLKSSLPLFMAKLASRTGLFSLLHGRTGS
jgi:hypothetical protein